VSAQGNGTVKVDFYVMSKCPDAQVCEQTFGDAIIKLNSIIDLQVNYIAKGDPSNYTCLHGPTECVGNTQQLCVESIYRNTSGVSPLVWWEFDVCQSATRTEIPGNGPACAQTLGLNYDKISSCANSTVGSKLLNDSFTRTKVAGETISCTINLNNQFWCQHNGPWVNCTEGNDQASFIKAVCKRYSGGNPPSICNSYLHQS